MRNKTIIDKFIEKYNNGDTMHYDDDVFNEYLNNYDANKHNINTNIKVLFILSMKLNEYLKDEYLKYIRYSAEAPPNELYNPTPEQIIKNAESYIQKKYKALINFDKQFTLIKKIKVKYNKPLQDEDIIVRTE